MAFNNSNIKFLQGSYDALKQLKTSQPGAFYVTNDTHEMFLGVDASKAPVALNRWVDVKNSWADVQNVEDYKYHPGKIYYAINENILCTWTEAKGWVQINPDTDTNDNTSVASIDFDHPKEVTETSTDGKVIITGYEYTLTLQQQDKNGNTIGNPLTATFTITDDIVSNLIVDVAVGLEASISNNTATIKTVGEGADTTKAVTLTSDGGITVGGTNNNIKVTGTTYELTSNESGAAEVILQSSRNDATRVLFTGDTWIAPAANGERKIKIEHTGPGAGEDLVATSGDDVFVNATQRKFTALTGIQKDAKGHIVGATSTEFTIPNSNFKLNSENDKVSVTNIINGEEVTDEAEFTLQVELCDAATDVVVSETDVKTAHTITVDGIRRIIANGEDIGDFYSSTEIDRILRVTNALTYKGTVNSADNLPTTGVSLGDVYKVSVAFGKYQIGDLLIANGASEDDNGHIVGTITWDHISTGEDTDTQYVIKGLNNKIQLIYANGVNAGIVVKDSDNNNIEITVTDDDKHIVATVTDNELNIEHATKNFNDQTNGDKTDTKTATAGGTVDVVTAIKKDNAGHIDGVTTTTITLPGADKVDLQKNHFTITDAKDITKGDLNFVDKLSTETDKHKISVNTEVDSANKSLRVTFNHDTQDVVKSSANKDKTIGLSAETNEARAFDVLESVSYDDYGHITGYQSKKITIGKQSDYSLTTPSVTNNVATQTMQRDGSTSVGSINLASDTLTYSTKTVGDTTLTHINMLWGSFETTV